ncbi:uncharacterized protein SCHCODRAFT_01093191 [Schizophyllum commune H4-8]|nr:uncharacterized protein SCHCODRAFT_01093191 [Schizophyllum commune H4-8]KAI5895939.1 hypothetical protein SCHCODRAFT_01093191 [Schizophyllum commune H4-8]
MTTAIQPLSRLRLRLLLPPARLMRQRALPPLPSFKHRANARPPSSTVPRHVLPPFQHRANARPPPPTARRMRQLASSSSFCKIYAPTRFLLLLLLLQDLRANSLPCANLHPCANSLPPLLPSSSAAPTRFLFLQPQALRQLASSRQLASFLLPQVPRQLASSSSSSFKHHANACTSSCPQALRANSLPSAFKNHAMARPLLLRQFCANAPLPSTNAVSKVLLPMEDALPVTRDGFVPRQGSSRETQTRRPLYGSSRTSYQGAYLHPRPSRNKPDDTTTLICHPQAPTRCSALPTRVQDLARARRSRYFMFSPLRVPAQIARSP